MDTRVSRLAVEGLRAKLSSALADMTTLGAGEAGETMDWA